MVKKRSRLQKSRDVWRRGDPAVLLTSAGLVVTVMLMLGMLGVVTWYGTGVFWPGDVEAFETKDGDQFLGPVYAVEFVRTADGSSASEHRRINVRKGNRDVYGIDFVWIDEADIVRRWAPEDAVVVERMEWGNAHGFIKEVRTPAGEAATDEEARFDAAVAAVAETDVKEKGTGAEIVFETVGGREMLLRTGEVVGMHQPNRMGLPAKLGKYVAGVWGFVFGEPRESNTEGGIWPALFGTCMMVLIMSVAVMPLGVMAALYLHEYAKQGTLVRGVRVAVSNLAGVPSIVFGLFGLGFFVYAVGGTLDSIFFSDSLPTPTFGTGGILWASLTLALLTLPVVIVATEEALASVPRASREGSLALGATKWETIRRVVLPHAGPGILTGLILAVARGAGEVAPLMLTGAVKLAPQMPFDASFPFFHFDRKFMHLGFHIYDLGFQSPNVEAAKPMVYATTLLLILVVVGLNVSAVIIRARLRTKLQGSAF